MPSFQRLAKGWPLPSLRDLESSHFELNAGPYPEFTSLHEKHPSDTEAQEPSKLRQRVTGSLGFLARAFARSPKAINEKREALLSSSAAAECEGSRRSSTDDESQTSTDASTLLEPETVVAAGTGSGRADARFISDAIIGLSDGLTVPFALTAGLSALGNTQIVVFAGLAELSAGAISMGLGGYLGAKSEEESYKATLSSMTQTVASSSATAAEHIRTIFAPYDLPSHLSDDLTFHLAKSPHLVQFLMHFQHALPEAQASSRALTCALTIAAGYFLGGFIPLLPYFLVGKNEVLLALWWSLGVMALSLFAFGYAKTCFVCGWRGSGNIWKGVRGGVQMVVVGGVAAGCAMGLVRLFNSLAES